MASLIVSNIVTIEDSFKTLRIDSTQKKSTVATPDECVYEKTDKIYRFKFSEEFQILLVAFTDVHRFDDPDLFKESWDEWVIENNSNIEKESTRLVNMGCNKNIHEKMYRSVRYYLKNKSIQKKKTKKRRKYVHFNKKLLKDMDIHIMDIAFRQGFKPEFAFNNFISDNRYSSLMDGEKERLLDADWEEVNIDSKIKKTYKNRYFIQQKKNNDSKRFV